MAVAEWTYEVAPAGGPSNGLEEYVVLDTDGARAGKVTTLLRLRDELWLVVERGTPPVSHDARALPWAEVATVDHEGLTVVIRRPAHQLEGALALDPDKGVERTGDEPSGADAVRVLELPDEIRPATTAGGAVAGPADRPAYAAALVVGALGIFAVLVAVVVATLADLVWALVLFAVAAVVLFAAGVLGYRAFHFPYERA